MKQKPKKGSVKKNKDNIEVSIGDGSITKYDIMTAIAKKYTIYESTVWLNTPIHKKGNKTNRVHGPENLTAGTKQKREKQKQKIYLRKRRRKVMPPPQDKKHVFLQQTRSGTKIKLTLN